MRLYGSSDAGRRVERAFLAASGRLNVDRHMRAEIGSFIRQAISLEHLERYEEAEASLLAALQRLPENPDLVAQLGVLYSRWRPVRRVAEAGDQFKRAWQLRCHREAAYLAWADMEARDQAWTESARAAELGIEVIGDTMRLLQAAGYARSRLGQELKRGLHTENAERELRIADKLFRRALKSPELLKDASERAFNRKIYRSLVLNSEALDREDDVFYFLERWEKEHPEDWYAPSEGERLRLKYGRNSMSSPPAW